MWIIEFLKKSLEGRGFYPALMVVFSWTYTVVLVAVIICQVFLYIFGVKYYNPEFNNANEEIDEKKKGDE
jgi:hypothetical protein